MIETVIQWDRNLFRIINQNLYSDAMDFIMKYLSERWFWLPLYLLLIIYIVYAFRIKALWIIGAALLLVASSDAISSQVIKKSVQRYRPCREEVDLGFDVRLLPGAGCSEYGFVSSHAANSFGLVVFFGLLFYKQNKWWLWGGLIWASVISFSRIYLGQHYPLDIIGGALLGGALAFFWHKVLIMILKHKEL
jgi:undecaprenyl-diphosphatase